MRRTNLTILLVALVTTSLLAVGAVGGAAAADDASESTDVTLTVTVVDGLNNGIDSAEVTAEWDDGSTTRQTAGNGKVFITVPEGETVTLRVQHPGYVRNNPVVVESASEESVEITVYSKARADVSVTNPNGEPVEGATVKLFKRDTVAASGQTGADGTFDSGVVERGEYRVEVSKSGYYRNSTNATLTTTGESVGVQVEQGTVPVTFTVQDDHFSPAEPIEGASVEIENVGTLRTSSDGTQTAAVPVNSRVTLSVSKDGYETKQRTVSVGESSREVSFTINREDELNLTVDNERIVTGTKLRVEVTDEYGDPVEGAAVTVDGEQVGTTNADGVYRVTLEETGEHEIAANKGGVTSDAATVEAVEPAAEETPTATGTATDTATATSTGDSQLPVPGFGLPAALLALAGVVALLRRR